MGGESANPDDATNYLRAVYSRVSRARSGQMQSLFDFPAPIQTAPDRDGTTSTLQQVYLMNSPLVQNLADAAVKNATANVSGQKQQVAALYRQILARDPTPAEEAKAAAYLQTGTMPRKAQIQQKTNEEIFLP